MDLGIEGKIALVTGGGRGLGMGIALNLAKEGAKVIIVSRTMTDLEKVMKKMGGKKKGHYAIAADLAQEGKPAKVMKEVCQKVGSPDIIVNNLGGDLFIKDPFCPISDWRRIWRLNVEIGIEINNLALPDMIKRGWGRIVAVSSIASRENQGAVPYCSVKAALNAYVRSMGRYVSPNGVIMTAVLPGAVFTQKGYWDITSKKRPEHVKKYLEDRMAIKRFGTLDEIGTMVSFLCSQHASFCVGSIVPVDGGQGRCF